ncbi:MAG: threonine synthase [Candidatus Caldatribacteriaceae bacterium]
MRWPGILEYFAEYLPITGKTPHLTLQEGNTPLIASSGLRRKCKVGSLFFKFEGMNPTGSFKDRGMVVAIAKAKEEGKEVVMCASTGNTSASAAAYAGKAGLSCAVLIPQGKIALGKLSQALMHGARVIAVRGNFDQALQIVRFVTSRYPVALVNSLNPHRIEGQKTASFEIWEWLGDVPDFLALPVGNAGNITAYWKGFKELFGRGNISRLPKMFGFQAAGSCPLVLGKPVENPQTIATAIRIGNPASWKGAIAAKEESGGLIGVVTDEEILEAQRMLAEEEGLFVEPASAASVAGVMKMARSGFFSKKDTVVCILTGHGLKDPDIAIKQCQDRIEEVDASPEEVVRVLGL